MKVTRACENCGQEFTKVVAQNRIERTKFCSKKCLDEWTAKQRGWDGIPWTDKKKDYLSSYQKTWRAENPDYDKQRWASEVTQAWHKEYKETENYRKSSQKKRNKFRYGVSPEWIKEKLEDQGGTCPICNIRLYFVDGGLREKKDNTVHIDHDHGTGNVRGLLSGNCNASLASFKDNKLIIQSAVDYLRGLRKSFQPQTFSGSKSPISWNHIKSRFKLHQKDWIKLWEDQGGRCLICEIESEHLQVDHDHTCCPTDRTCGTCIRGLLCKECNSGIGKIQERVDWLQNAIDYLNSYEVQT